MIKRAWGTLYLRVLAAVVLGALLGVCAPSVGVALKPLGDGFVRLIHLLVSPLVFATITLGIMRMRDLRQVGRVGLKAILYFEVTSTAALALGVLVANLFRPGDGFHIDPSSLDAGAVAHFADAAHAMTVTDFLLGIIPTTMLSALTSGDALQALLCAVLTGCAAAAIGPRAQPLADLLESGLQVMYRAIAFIMWLAPIGAFGAMAFTVGKFGWHSLAPLARFMGVFYGTCLFFVFGGLGLIARASGFSVWRLAVYLKTELLTVLGTSSSESVLAPLMAKLEALGCQRTSVGLVVPTGYSFNLDGTAIYMSLAAIFLAQATDTPLSPWQQLGVLAVAMVSSKGAATVTGGGFIALAATLAVVPSIPISALAIIIGIDRFMSEARSLTNLMGNAVATLAISRWEGDVRAEEVRERLLPPPESN